jgi:hypothetical protein
MDTWHKSHLSLILLLLSEMLSYIIHLTKQKQNVIHDYAV